MRRYPEGGNLRAEKEAFAERRSTYVLLEHDAYSTILRSGQEPRGLVCWGRRAGVSVAPAYGPPPRLEVRVIERHLTRGCVIPASL